MSAPVTLTGRLVADPELRFGQTGTAIVNLRVVTSTRYKDGDEWKDKDTTWWSVSAFRGLAENIAESLSKGDAVLVVGTVRSREYETREGEKRTAWEVDARHVGPDLSRAVAKPQKVQRADGGYGQPSTGYQQAKSSLGDDPWATNQSAEAPF